MGTKGKKKVKAKSHNHIGPNVRAFRVGKAFCAVCNGEQILRLTEKERESERAVFAAKGAPRDYERTRRS